MNDPAWSFPALRFKLLDELRNFGEELAQSGKIGANAAEHLFTDGISKNLVDPGGVPGTGFPALPCKLQNFIRGIAGEGFRQLLGLAAGLLHEGDQLLREIGEYRRSSWQLLFQKLRQTLRSKNNWDRASLVCPPNARYHS